MQRIRLEDVILVHHNENHEKSKKMILEKIEVSESERLGKNSDAMYDVSSSDWQDSFNFDREWTKVFDEELRDVLTEMFQELGYTYANITNMWFQRYETMSVHDWHIHPEVNLAAVYFLELPEESSETKIISPYDKKTIVEIGAKEGDLIIFPAHCFHQAPLNLSDKTRSVIAFNINVYFNREEYKKSSIKFEAIDTQ
jgi:hypothetical protein